MTKTAKYLKRCLPIYATGAGLGKWGIFGLDGDLIGFVMLKAQRRRRFKSRIRVQYPLQILEHGIATKPVKF